METVQKIVCTSQQVRSWAVQRPQEIRSAELSQRFWRHPDGSTQDARRPVRSQPELTARQRFVVLRGQLRLLRLRAQAGLPVSPAAIGRAERLLDSLEFAA